MPSSKRLRTPIIVTFGVIMAAVTFAGPASAADGVYPPENGTTVLGTSETAPQAAPVEVAGVSESAVAGVSESANELAFTGSNAIGVGALGGLLLVGGTALVMTGKRRKGNV